MSKPARREPIPIPTDVGALTTQEAARYLRMERHQIYTAIELGQLRCYGGKRGYLFPRKELDRYIEWRMSEREKDADNVRAIRP